MVRGTKPRDVPPSLMATLRHPRRAIQRALALMGPIDFLIGILWVTAPLAIGIGVSLVGPKPSDFNEAKVLFQIGFTCLAVSAVIWALYSHSTTIPIRLVLVVVVVIVALAGCEWLIGLAKS